MIINMTSPWYDIPMFYHHLVVLSTWLSRHIPMTSPCYHGVMTIPGDFLELSAEVGLSLAVPQLGPLGVEAGKLPMVKCVKMEDSSGNLGTFSYWYKNWYPKRARWMVYFMEIPSPMDDYDDFGVHLWLRTPHMNESNLWEVTNEKWERIKLLVELQQK